ncbi:MAG: hypothetical protein LBW77_02865, partial [Verrucomicrobiota bacterium]|nr:hypothetical protein [Verrucomicrobiota bacterium]
MKFRLLALTLLAALGAAQPGAADDVSVSATHEALIRVTGSPVTLRCSFAYPIDRELLSLLWAPDLPAGWSIVPGSAEAEGEGAAPSIDRDGAALVFAEGAVLPNPVTFRFAVQPPTPDDGSALTLHAFAEYMLDGMPNPDTVDATPDPLIVAVTIAIDDNGTPIPQDDSVRVPGPDSTLGNDDDVVIFATPGGSLPAVILPWGYVLVPDGSDVRYGDGTPVLPSVPADSVVLLDGTVIRPNPVSGLPPEVDRATGAITVHVPFTLTEGATFADASTRVTTAQVFGQAAALPDLSGAALPPGRAFADWVDAYSVTLAAQTTVDAAFAVNSFLSVWQDGGGERPPGFIVTLNPQGGAGGTDS